MTARAVFANDVDCWTEGRLYEADPEDVRTLLREVDDSIDRLAVVGHNPTVHALCRELLEKRTIPDEAPAGAGYPPGTLSIIDLPISSWSEVTWGEGSLLLFHRE
jgi:phosphohistidine phosphatase SixA